MKSVLGNAHEDYARRVQAGENPEEVMNELENGALTELKSLMQ